MADNESVSVESSHSGDEDNKRRCLAGDINNSKFCSDKHLAGKHKPHTFGGPEVGSSYLIRRLDDTYRKRVLKTFVKFKTSIAKLSIKCSSSVFVAV